MHSFPLFLRRRRSSCDVRWFVHGTLLSIIKCSSLQFFWEFDRLLSIGMRIQQDTNLFQRCHLRTRSTFCRLLCFWKVFLECQVYAHDEREMFYFIFNFLLCYCLNPPTTNAGTRGGALPLPRSHGLFHAHMDAC